MWPKRISWPIVVLIVIGGLLESSLTWAGPRSPRQALLDNFKSATRARTNAATNTASAPALPATLDYTNILCSLEQQDFIQQLSFSGLRAVEVWQKFPQEGLKLGNYYIEQLKKYWAQNERLQKEVAIEVSPNANYIIQSPSNVFTMRSAKLSHAYEKFIQQDNSGNYKILGIERDDQGKKVAPAAPRQVVRFKYVGGASPKTVLGEYLKKVLAPKKITLVFDPQATLLNGLAASYGGDLAAGDAQLAISARILHDILTANVLREVDKHPILQHELAHHKLENDQIKGKFPLLAGDVSFTNDDLGVQKIVLAALTGNDYFALPTINIEECYTYNVGAWFGWQKAEALLKKMAIRISSQVSEEDLRALGIAVDRVRFDLANAYQHMRAAYFVGKVALPAIGQEEFARNFYRNVLAGNIGFSFGMKFQEGKTTEMAQVIYYFPELLLKHPIQENPPAPDESFSEVQLDGRDIARVKAFLEQQNNYLLKMAAQNEAALRAVDELLERLQHYFQDEAARPAPRVLAQDEDPVFKKLAENLRDLAKYPPYFNDEASR